MAVRLSGRSNIGDSLTGQRKCHVERGRRGAAADNVGADSQPIRRQIRIPDPGLAIRRKRGAPWDGPWARQVKEVAAGEQNFGAEEILTRRQNDGACERYRDLDFLAREFELTTGLHSDAVHHSVVYLDAWVQDP